MQFDPGFDIQLDEKQLNFIYGPDTFGPEVEQRHLDDIRKSLRDPKAVGPKIPYAIAMDVGKKKDLMDLESRNLLYGAVIYSKGQFGEEPVRSQGHIHAISPSCNASTPEVYEIWNGAAIIYMQETAKDNPGRCYAIYAEAGDVVIVPPKWAHCTVNADPKQNMAFGAWCVRDYGFEYEDVRAHGGLAYFPIMKDKIEWIPNEAYEQQPLVCRGAREYPEFDLKPGVPIYQQYEENPELFTFVSKPATAIEIWKTFEP